MQGPLYIICEIVQAQ